MTTVFLDTVGLIALWDESDQWHAQAEAAIMARWDQPLRLITTSFVHWRQAWALFSSAPATGAGIVDCVSFVVMRRLGIQQVFSNDHHFRAAGYETLF